MFEKIAIVVSVLGSVGGIAAADPDPCSPAALKLPAAAKHLATWTPPETCTPTEAPRKQVVVGTQAEFDNHFTCTAKAKQGLDWAKQRLVMTNWMMSPGSVGLDAYDDGKTITLVSRERSSCPHDPMPMPMTRPIYWTSPIAGGERTFAQAHCSVTPKCK